MEHEDPRRASMPGDGTDLGGGKVEDCRPTRRSTLALVEKAYYVTTGRA